MRREDLTEKILDIKREKGWTWKHITDEIGGMSPVLVVGALLGQMKLVKPLAAKAAALFGLSPAEERMLNEVPHRGTPMPPTDPLIYRFYELVMVNGPAWKALIEEEFGDGIMSAIDFDMEIERLPNPKGDRVKITMSGKFLPYKYYGNEQGIPSTASRRRRPAILLGNVAPFGRRQRQAQRHAALEPRARAVARLAVEGLQPLQDVQDAAGAEALAPLERAERIAEAELGALVDVGGRGDGALGHPAADVDDHGHHALRHEAGAVVDDHHLLAVGGEQAVRGIAHGGIGGRRHHQGARALHAEQHVDGDGCARHRASDRHTAVVRSQPIGVSDDQSVLSLGLSPVSRLAPACLKRSISGACRSGWFSLGRTHTDFGRAARRRRERRLDLLAVS